jgi:ribosomal protein L7/L12
MSDNELAELKSRVTQLEQKLEFLLQALGLESKGTVIQNSAIIEQLRLGNKINAVKLYREQTGVGLKEAKDAVDAFGRTL